MSYRLVSLGVFQPSRLSTDGIRNELMGFLEMWGIRGGEYGIAVRTPEDHMWISIEDVDVQQWHRDGNDAPDGLETPALRYLIFWSNGTATQVAQTGDATHRPTNDDCFELGRGHVLLVDNVEMWHRCPPPEPNRWFARLNEPLLPVGFLD